MKIKLTPEMNVYMPFTQFCERSKAMETICKTHNLCTGCTACENICPKQCIEMKVDEEGFKYPFINHNKCINCEICKETCPVNNSSSKYGVLAGYVARYKDIDTVIESTSGGSFSAFANYTFSRDGLLYGVGYNERMVVRHFGIDKSQRSRVSEMIGSKYVQSELGDTFSELKRALVDGKFVCFSGTPCQVAGLKAFLKKDYDNLLTVDLVCHGVASPLFFERYVSYMQNKGNLKITNIKFRNKTYGYHSGTMMVEYENGKKYYGSGRVDYMSMAYFKGTCSRYSCYKCPFKGIERVSDFTVFDSWHVDKLVPSLKDDDKGFTNIFVRTEKGLHVIEEMKTHLEMHAADVDQMRLLDGVMIDKQPEMDSNRDTLIKQVEENGFETALKCIYPISRRDYILEKCKRIIYKAGLMKVVKGQW